MLQAPFAAGSEAGDSLTNVRVPCIGAFPSNQGGFAHSHAPHPQGDCLRSGAGLLIPIYFLSGACSLAYEIIWQRQLKLTLGNTTYATSITVGVFMAGLAIGSYLVRNRADRFRNPIRAYSIVELLISVCALLIPLAFSGIDALYVTAYRSLALSGTWFLFAQVFVPAICLLVPTALMGSTLPILSAWIVRTPAQTGPRIGVLYGLNTLGAMAGAALTGFVLIRCLGLFPAYYVAVAANVVLSAAAFGLSTRPMSRENGVVSSEPAALAGKVPRMLVDMWLFVSGFVALGYEVIWIRTATQALYSEVYTFAAILCVYLGAYATGAWSGGFLVRMRGSVLTKAAVTLQIVGLAGVLYIPYLVATQNFSAHWYLALRTLLLPFDSYVVVIAQSVVLFTIPSFVMGLNFPLLVHLRRSAHAHTGDTVAGAYSLNTIGGVLGSLAAGFILVPFAGATTGIGILGALAVAAGALAVFVPNPRRTRMLLSAAAVAIAAASWALTPPNQYERWISACQNRGHRPTKLVDMIQGINTTASVHEFIDTKERVISSAGMDVAGDSPELRQTQKVQGHVPVILHGNPRDVLTVGFGSGELTKLLTLHRIPRITCVEIAPEMVALSKRNFAHLNLGDSLERKVTMVYMDARNYMHLTDKTYDIIMNDCTWPGYSDASSALYTREYFEDGKRSLRDSGVYSTWLPINIPELSLRSIICTFDRVFENAIIVYPHATLSQHMLLVGQKAAHPYSYAAMGRAFDTRDVKESLRSIGVYDVDDVVNMILSQSATMQKLVAGRPENSDRMPVVEFDVNRSRTILEPALVLKRLWLLVTETDAADLSRLLTFAPMGEAESAATLDALKRNQLALQYFFAASFSSDRAWKMKQIDEGLAIAPHYPALLALREAAAR